MELSNLSLQIDRYLQLLQSLILFKLAEDELDIGLAQIDGKTCAVLSLDEYDQSAINIHLYCSLHGFFIEVVNNENDDAPEEIIIPIPELQIQTLPEGLRKLMLEVAAKKKGLVFKSAQI